MKRKISVYGTLFRLSFFLLVIGNGEFITQKLGYTVEYVGLVLLIICELMTLKRSKKTINKIIYMIIPVMLMSFGPFILIPTIKKYLQ